MFIDLYNAQLICFDNEGEGGSEGDTDGGNDAGSTTQKATFDDAQQEFVNKLLAEERRKTAQKAEKEAAQREKQRIQELLTEKDLGEKQRAKLEEDYENAMKRLRSKEDQDKYEREKAKKEYDEKLSAAEKRAQAIAEKYRKSQISRALQDAAVTEDAYNPNIVVTYLENKVKWNDDTEEILVELTVPTNEGKEEPALMTPHEAVKRMKTMVQEFGGLFKSNVVSGIGGTSGAGGGSGKIDPAKLTMDEYMEIRQKNPEKLGLSRRH
jgi:hypothetical protein